MKNLLAFLVLFFLINACEKAKPPTVLTSSITEVAAYYVVAECEVLDDGGAAVTERGLCLTTSSETLPYYYSDNYYFWYAIDTSGVGIGTFSIKAKNKWYGATGSMTSIHTIRAYAKNSAGIGYGEALSFVPLDRPLYYNTISHIKNIIPSSTSALVEYGWDYVIDFRIDDWGLCYGTNSEPTIEDNVISDDVDELHNYNNYTSITIENLTPNTVYYIRAYDKNNSGTVYGAQKSFTTTSK